MGFKLSLKFNFISKTLIYNLFTLRLNIFFNVIVQFLMLCKIPIIFVCTTITRLLFRIQENLKDQVLLYL